MGQTNNNTRYSNIELLRFVLMLAIYIWHLVVHGLNYKMIGREPYGNNLELTFIICALLCPAVNTFMFISGWFGIRFKTKKLIMLGLLAFLCSVLTYAVSVQMGLVRFEPLAMIRHFIPISTSLWWFMTSYIMVYLFSPLINAGFEHLPRKQIDIVLIALTMIQVLSIISTANLGSTFFGLLYMYFLGRYMKTYRIIISRNKALILWSLSAGLLVVGQLVINHFAPRTIHLFRFLGYHNPLIILQAIGIFFFTWQLPRVHKPLFNTILTPTLCIYLITEQLPGLYKYQTNLLATRPIHGVLFFVGIILGSLLLGHILFAISTRLSDLITERK